MEHHNPISTIRILIHSTVLVTSLRDQDLSRRTTHGSLNQTNQPRPFKRPRPNGPIITRYAPPPHYPPQYPPQQGQYGPPTPVAAHPQAYQPWPNQPPHSYAQQQQPPPHSHPHPHQQSQYGPHGIPTPITPHGSQFPSPVSAQSFHQPGPYPHPTRQYHPYEGQYGGQASSPPQMSPEQVSPRSYDQPFSPQQPPPTTSAPRERSQSTAHSLEKQFHHEPQADEDGEITQETLLEELSELDHRSGAHVEVPAGRLARPLPAKPTDSDAFTNLPRLSEGEDKSISRYFSLDNVGHTSRSVRQTADWIFFKEDPVFRRISDNCEMIPLSELMGRQQWQAEDLGTDDYDDQDDKDVMRRNYAASDGSSDGHDEWNVMDNLENALNARVMSDSGTQPGGNSGQSPVLSRTHRGSAGESAEETLARLGVTGNPKPVSSQQFALQPDDPQRRNSNSRRQSTGRRSRSPSRSGDGYHSDQRSPINTPILYPGYRDRETLSGRTASDRREDDNTANRKADDGGSKFRKEGNPPHTYQNRRLSYEHSTPHITQSRGQHGNVTESPHSGSSREHSQRSPTGWIDGSNGQSHPTSNRRSASPPNYYGAENDRDYRHREEDEEMNGKVRRQVDDVTPKMKRKQPKVAEVYR
ncbi:MAG: hypothetical protein M1833_006902 [Piccolia ochrophora]|nr:MAG: hypothetical protein M1833_006902 [Piccolia ochrophora]